jgi:hypothetical protein
MTGTRKKNASARRKTIVATYAVGKYKPPVSGQIKPGEVRNPYGRKGKNPIGGRDVNFFLDEQVTIKTSDGAQTYTRRELMNLAIASRCAKGDPAAIRSMLLLDQVGKSDELPVDPLLFNPDLTEEAIKELTKGETEKGAAKKGTARKAARSRPIRKRPGARPSPGREGAQT